MTEERDPKVSAAYRGLGAEEPPRALDEAILAAARREAGARPAPLALRAGRQRWYAPLATAAVLVLAVAVTLNIQTERPGIESPAQPATVPPPAADRAVAKAVEKQVEKEVATPAAAKDDPVARRKAEEQPATRATLGAAAPAAPAPAPKPFMAEKPAMAGSARSDDSRNVAPSVAGSLSQPLEERSLRDAQPAARAPQAAAPAQALAKRTDSAETADRAERGQTASRAEAPARMQAQKLADTPERELERIAELRAQGRHEDADKALAEFRKRNPGYKIPEAMRARIERR